MSSRSALVLLLSLLIPSAATAQTLSGDLTVAGVNTLLGAATAGVSAWIRGDSFTDALPEGALGGSIVYGGKRLASARFNGAGLAGRLIASGGTSIIRNSGAGLGAFDEFAFPVGPVILHWISSTGDVTARVRLSQTAYLGYLALRDRYDLDWGASLSGGAPVFRTPGQLVSGPLGVGASVAAAESMGSIKVSDPAILYGVGADYNGLLAHERVHVLQHDFLAIAWADPVEDWLLEHLPWGEEMRRYIQVGGLAALLDTALNRTLPPDRRPWETEACYLDGRSGRKCLP